MSKIILLIALLSITQSTNPNELYDSGISSIINLNPMNFATQITNNRAKNVISLVHFYKLNDGKSKEFKKVIEEFDKNFEGMFKIAGLNCGQYHDLCSKENVNEFPSFMVYPPLPAPVMKYEGQMTPNHIVSYLGRFVDNKAQELNNNNFDEFINEHANLPKVILFTDKKNVPLLFRRLSTEFDKKIDFGIVRSDMTGITSKYRVKSFPRIMRVRVDKKTEFYEGELKYKSIHEFCNAVQETFFVVGEDTTGVEQPKKPWMTEKFPEINKESGNEICFKVEGSICVFLINKEKPDSKLENVFMDIQNWLSPKINRGIKYKFGWVNSSIQTDFIKAINMEKGDGPKLILINHGTRKRFHTYEGELEVEPIKQMFDKLASGELRFTTFKGNNIPELNE